MRLFQPRAGQRRRGPFASTLLLVVLEFSTACGAGDVSPTGTAGGVDTALVNSAFVLAQQQPNLTSLVVARNGTLERQAYFNGGGANTAQDVRSVTKSVVSLLVGIALARGQLRSLDQTVGELLGPLAPVDPAKAAITLRQLLTMTSGLGGDELADVSLYNQWAAAPDQLMYVWDLPLAATPGTRFNYYSPNFYILARILTRATSQGTSDFARDALFAPLGIGARAWETDARGYVNGGAGLSLSPMDMVALGNLVLDNGRTGGWQVVSVAWMQAATQRQVSTTAMSSASGYGYGWWTGQSAGTDYVFATGHGGQFIVVVPQKRLVVTAAAHWSGVGTATANAQWLAVMDLIVQRIVRAY